MVAWVLYCPIGSSPFRLGVKSASKKRTAQDALLQIIGYKDIQGH
jgi:hypothetical protein